MKGRAPLLMPHPGDHMTPMSGNDDDDDNDDSDNDNDVDVDNDRMTILTDDAVTKQNKLRTLRHEMIQVSDNYVLTILTFLIPDEEQDL